MSPWKLHPEDRVSCKVAVLDPDVEGFDLVGALVRQDVSEENLEAIVKLEVGRNLVKRHVAEVDAWELKQSQLIYVTCR